MKFIDLHCDTISAIQESNESLINNSGQYDVTRALRADLLVQFFAMFTMPSDSNIVLRSTLKQVNKFLCEVAENNQYLFHVKTYEDLLAADHHNKMGCILHLEGAEALGVDLDMLDLLYKMGLRSLGLTWNYRNLLADGVAEGKFGGGISKQGRRVIELMSSLGIALDLAHISEKCYFEALECYDKPVLVTHANCRTLCDHPRNLTDEQLQALAQNGGIIGITQVSDFIKESKAEIDDMINHIVHIAELIGVKHIALGSDFDGADSVVISDISGYQDLPGHLSKRGFDKKEIEMIASGNALRVLQQVLV